MVQLDQAAKQLQAALDRLERAVEARLGDGTGDEAALRAALATVRKENAVLQKSAAAVAARLDATIARLKSTLES